MSEHLLFLQAAGTDFGSAHELAKIVTDSIKAQHNAQISGVLQPVQRHDAPQTNASTSGHSGLDPERIAECVDRAGGHGPEGLLVALATYATVASPLNEVDVDWIASAAARVGKPGLLVETTGVVFAFNFINRVADARRVRLEYHFLRELKPIKGWVERRLASLTGLAYDLSFKYQTRRTPAEMLDRLSFLFEQLGAQDLPDIFDWLGQSPVVLEGVLEMIDGSLTGTRVRPDLLKEAAGIAVASRPMSRSGLGRVVDQWLAQGSLPDSTTLRTWAAPSGGHCGSGLVWACRRYAWRVANAAYTVCDDQIHKLMALGLSNAEILDLTLVTALFSALAIIEPIGAGVPSISAAVSSMGAALTPVPIAEV